jgi:hypothetical protein
MLHRRSRRAAARDRALPATGLALFLNCLGSTPLAWVAYFCSPRVVSTGVAPPPAVLVQYGQPRTATTLQFQILCASTCLSHGANTTCEFNCAPPPPGGRDRPAVCKYHSIERALRAANEPGASFFATANRTAPPDDASARDDGEPAWRRTARALEREWAASSRAAAPLPRHAPLAYVQATDELGRRGYHIALEYQRALALSDADAAALLECVLA